LALAVSTFDYSIAVNVDFYYYDTLPVAVVAGLGSFECGTGS
jgi:hypothetical protein